VGQRIIKILVVEDNGGDVCLLKDMIGAPGPDRYELVCYETMKAAVTYLLQERVDVILVDLGLPDAQGLDIVRWARSAAPNTPIVVLTEEDDESLALQALKQGAQDYLVKGQIDATGLRRVLRYAVERKSIEDARYVENERAQFTLDSIGDAVVSTDAAGRITFFNFAAERTTGYTLREVHGRRFDELFSALAPSAVQRFQPSDEAATTSHRILDCILVRRDGSEIAIEGCIAPIHGRSGVETGTVAVFRDVSEARATTTEMAHSAQHDFLTGLPNRLLLRDRIQHALALATRHAKKVAILFLDLDGFKQINDSLGHDAGDVLLQSVAIRLAGCVRGSDTVSRQGGDEFVVLLSEVEHSEDAAISANRILDAVAQPHRIDGRDLPVTTSIGISLFPDDGADAETLIKNADTAMYQAKENGRHAYRFFSPAMNARASERQGIERALRLAFERGEFVLHYQPKIDLWTGAIVGAEALLRWIDPAQGVIMPARFVRVAEDCGIIVPLGEWVMRTACTQAKAWAVAGVAGMPVAVNISGAEFNHQGFARSLFEVLGDCGLDPSLLELDLTEAVLMRHVESTKAILRGVRARGVRVAVDDFGTGYSSLSQLQAFAVDALKIDGTFVRQIAGASAGTAIVGAVIGMARSLDLQVVAEGVETPAELAFLREYRCDQAMGHYFSPPLAPDQFLTMLLSRRPRGSDYAAPPRHHALHEARLGGL
jgi:diguanylate cyclase (GGDEF)-like protein/PAS domain S-box-containing protein